MRVIIQVCLCLLLFSSLAFASLTKAKYPAPKAGCLSCHKGIEMISDVKGQMAEQIFALGKGLGDANGCVVCHGGNPSETKNKLKAHLGAPKGGMLSVFTPVPGSFDVSDKTCGSCHPKEVASTKKSIMNTEAGKIKVITYGWGVDNNSFAVKYGNFTQRDEDGATPIYGTKEYKAYMHEVISQHIDQFPQVLKEIPKTDVKNIAKDPKTAVFNFMRNCNACHTSGKGKLVRGHFRGVGCASCHMPYSEAGRYEGGDKTISPKKTGVMMVHTLQATRKSKVHVNGGSFSGVQVSTCNACHSSGRRITSQYQGLYPTDKGGKYFPFNKDGKLQQPNASYLYKHVGADVHFERGMICQDCHTSPDIHGNGNLGTVTLGDVEIECQDCHGTPSKYPWELKLGYSDNLFALKDIKDKKIRALLDKPRGLSKTPMEVTSLFATVYAPKDGYLLSARGNPLGNVIKDGKKVILHSATGRDLVVPVLKDIELNNKWKTKEGRLAMVGAARHLETMECYTCHSTWAASYFGYAYNMDFTKGKEFIDWIASSAAKSADGTAADYKAMYKMIAGSAPGDYSFARWEDPILGVNAEGKVSPLIGVIQTVGTVTDAKGKVVMLNNVAKDKSGMLTIDMQTMQPHTNVLKARACNSCHLNRVVMGFGESYNFDNATPIYLGVKDANGKMLSKYAKPQITGIKDLSNGRDFMKLLDAKGRQIMKVDAHFKESRALDARQIGFLSDPNYREMAQRALKKIDKRK